MFTNNIALNCSFFIYEIVICRLINNNAYKLDSLKPPKPHQSLLTLFLYLSRQMNIGNKNTLSIHFILLIKTAGNSIDSNSAQPTEFNLVTHLAHPVLGTLQRRMRQGIDSGSFFLLLVLCSKHYFLFFLFILQLSLRVGSFLRRFTIGSTVSGRERPCTPHRHTKTHACRER